MTNGRRNGLGAGLAALLLAGCATTDELAPPPGPAVLALGAARGAGPETLDRGRTIYLTKCVRCHSPEAVARYPVSAWEAILPRMAGLTGLTDVEREDVRAYVLTTREAQAGESS
ncbi:MAG: hypothetical protein ACYTG1_10115 [Planctomycetota bacterium]|jgi:mono/diheme cytochrome c family protein